MRNNLTLDDIFPNVEDGRILFERAVQYTAQILVEEFQAVCVEVPLCTSPELSQ